MRTSDPHTSNRFARHDALQFSQKRTVIHFVGDRTFGAGRRQAYDAIPARQALLAVPEPLPQNAFDAIAVHGALEDAFWDNQTKPGPPRVAAAK